MLRRARDLPVSSATSRRDLGRGIHSLRDLELRIGYMKSSTKDKVTGRAEQVKGVVKEKAGKATGSTRTQDSGTVDKVKGTVRNKVGDIKKVFGK